MTAAPLVALEHLSVAFGSAGRQIRAVTDVSFGLAPGERLGLLGESGSGKSLTALATAGLLPRDARMTGHVRWQHGGTARPGRDIGFVFQDPFSSLNPVLSVGEQVAEVAVTHLGLGWPQARDRAADLLDQVGIPDAARRLDRYPHEFSGGQRQRVAIAMAIAAGPRLLIADEPTTALDTVVQSQIAAMLDALVAERGMTLLLVSHDIAFAGGLVDRVAVMYAGRLVETAPIGAFLVSPRHPYAQGLLAASLDVDRPRAARLADIPGQMPSPDALPPGCPFAARCPHVREACLPAMPEWIGTPEHGVACVLYRQDGAGT